MLITKRIAQSCLLCLPFVIVACGGSSNNSGGMGSGMGPGGEMSDPPVDVSFMIDIYNNSNNQPLSPVAAIMHDSRYSAWSIGMPASAGLEMLAESGSPTLFMSEASTAFVSEAASDILMPGNNTSIMLEATLTAEEYASGELAFTLASMPVNTNDAFNGTTAWNLAGLEIGESAEAVLPVYDAGTEENLETAATIPGPAAGGEGFNMARDDVADQVTRHSGIVSSDDGYAESALDQSHRFDQGMMLVRITRMAP